MEWLKRLLGLGSDVRTLPRRNVSPAQTYDVKAAQAADLAQIQQQSLRKYQSQVYDPLGSAKKKTHQLVEERVETLARRRIELLKIDRYGVVDATGWNQEIQYFADKVVRPSLTVQEANAVATYGLGKLMTELVEDRVRIRVEEIEAEVSFSPDMKPDEFERWCRNILVSKGWTAENTPLTGDQGADVIAEKSGVRLVIQCKLYSAPVGNKAVQEAHSARTHYGARLAVVVTNAGFTPSAEALSRTTGTLLVSHLDLTRLDQLIRDRGVSIDVWNSEDTKVPVSSTLKSVKGRTPSLPM